MKKCVFFAVAALSVFSLFSQDAPSSADSGGGVLHKPGIAEIPEKKRPKKPDGELVREFDLTGEDDREKTEGILKFGMENDITELLDKIIEKGDVRFVDEIYDLFQETKNSSVREKILSFFTKIEDPCLEDYAVAVVNDPFDEKLSTVNAVFSYIQAVRTKAAVPAVLTLIENENEEYFNSALATLGEIGGSEEAVYLTEFLKREDLSVARKQQLVKVLGKLKAVETFDDLAEMAQDEDENAFVRMYCAEAIGAMQKEEAVPVLLDLYEESDAKIREYAVKGLAYFKGNADAEKTVLQATRDSHYRVRLEAIRTISENEMKDGVPYLIYRAKNDPENAVKKEVWPVIAKLNTEEGNKFLVEQITDKKVSDNTKSVVAKALLEFNNAGADEIIALARETLNDDRRKSLRYALGKEFAKYRRDEYAPLCVEYIRNKDVATQGTGLDMYAKGRYEEAEGEIRKLVLGAAKDSKRKNVNAEKAERILGKESEVVREADKIREEISSKDDELKKAKDAKTKPYNSAEDAK